MVDKKEILNQIVNVLEKPFVTHGFRYVRGGRFVRKLSDGNTEQQYHITFRKKYGCFLMSIELIVQNKVLLKDFDVLYRETLIFGYRNFEDNFRDECIKMVDDMQSFHCNYNSMFYIYGAEQARNAEHILAMSSALPNFLT